MVEQGVMANPTSPTRAAILTALAQAGRPMRPIEIAAATGKKLGTICNRLLYMRSDGQVEHAPCGRWQLTATTAHGALVRNIDHGARRSTAHFLF
jgi:DNA-binding IclR family transcriptional regulator